MFKKSTIITLLGVFLSLPALANSWWWEVNSDAGTSSVYLRTTQTTGGNPTYSKPTIINPKGANVRTNVSSSVQPPLIISGGASAALLNTYDSAITISNGSASVSRSSVTSYDITVSNNSSVPSQANVTWNIAGSGGATVTVGTATCQSVPSGGACIPSTAQVVLVLDAGTQAVIRVPVTVGAGLGTITANASVSMPNVTDADLSNNTDTDTDTVLPLSADLGVSLTNGSNSVSGGVASLYTIVFTNTSPTGVNALATWGATSTAGVPSRSVLCSGTTGGSTCATSGALYLAPNGSVSVNYTVTPPLPAGAGHTLSVNAGISVTTTGTVDPNLSNNTATDTDSITAAVVDVAVLTVDDAKNIIFPNTANTWNVVVANTGIYNANVSVGSVVTGSGGANPGVSSLVCGSSTAGNTCSASGNTATLVMRPNSSNTMALNTNSGSSYVGALNATVTASITTSGIADSNLANNSRTNSTSLTPLNADLQVTATTPTATIPQLNTVTYPITITNSGPNSGTGSYAFTLTNTGGGNMTIQSTTYAGATGGASQSGASFSMPSGSTLRYNVVVRNNASVGSATFRAVVTPTGSTSDLSSANNTYAHTLIASLASTDLNVSVVNAATSMLSGSTSIYTSTIRNSGSIPITALVSQVASASGSASVASLTPVTCSAASAGSSCVGNVVSLAANGTATYTATVGAGVGAPGTISYTISASISAGASDSNLSNNSVTDTNTVNAPSNDLAVSVVFPNQGNPSWTGGACDSTNNYTVTVRNNGGTFTGATTAQFTPVVAGVAPNTVSVGGMSCTTPAYCNNAGNIYNLTSGQSAVFNVSANVICGPAKNGNIQVGGNISSVSSVETSTANNSSLLTIAVKSVPFYKVCAFLGGGNAKGWTPSAWLNNTALKGGTGIGCYTTSCYYLSLLANWDKTTGAWYWKGSGGLVMNSSGTNPVSGGNNANPGNVVPNGVLFRTVSGPVSSLAYNDSATNPQGWNSSLGAVIFATNSSRPASMGPIPLQNSCGYTNTAGWGTPVICRGNWVAVQSVSITATPVIWATTSGGGSNVVWREYSPGPNCGSSVAYRVQ